MAYQTGTASDHVDLWDKFKAFITSDPELVASGQEWEVVWEVDSNSDIDFDNETDYVLRGPGLADQDSVYIALRRDDSAIASDVSTWYMRGATGIVPSANQYHLHINMTPFPVKMFTRPNTMDYWFFASGRRFIIVVQVGTVYETMYGGFFLPYAEPTVYSYPMFVGGSSGSGGPVESTSHTSVADDHAAFCYPAYNTASQSGFNPSAWMMDPSGNWLRCSINHDSAPCCIGPTFFGAGLGIGAVIAQTQGSFNYGYNDVDKRVGESYGGGFVMTPFTLVQATPSDQTFGVLDGVYRITGRGQSIENIIQAEDAVHVVFQNTFRTSLGNWFAVTRGPEDSNSAFIANEESNS
jgi:hypothetical protein